MELYKNIKSRRVELGYSQEYLANLLGYTDRSTIAKIEAGRTDLPVSKVTDFAKALMTTEAALMGWEVPDGYAELDSVDKAEIRGEIKQMLKAVKKETSVS